MYKINSNNKTSLDNYKDTIINRSKRPNNNINNNNMNMNMNMNNNNMSHNNMNMNINYNVDLASSFNNRQNQLVQNKIQRLLQLPSIQKINQ